MASDSTPFTFSAVHRPKSVENTSWEFQSRTLEVDSETMASNKEPETDSEWDLCEDAPAAVCADPDDGQKQPNDIPSEEPDSKEEEIASKLKRKLHISKGGILDTGLKPTEPDPKFYPVEPKDDSNSQSNGHDAYQEGDSLRKTLADMGFTTLPSALPKSFLRAAANRFTKEQVEQFTADLKLGYNNPLPYFVCGSFMFPATLRAITTGLTLGMLAANMCPATLRGFERRCVLSAEWPAIVPAADPHAEEAVVQGMMVFGIADSQRARVHRFEGGMFDLRRVTVQMELKDGSMWNHEAGVYVWNRAESRLLPLAEKKWSPDMLLTSQWHLRVISRTAKEEEGLRETSQNVLTKDW